MQNETLIRLLQHSMNKDNPDYYKKEESTVDNSEGQYEGEAEIVEDPSMDIAVKQNALRLIRERYLGK